MIESGNDEKALFNEAMASKISIIEISIILLSTFPCIIGTVLLKVIGLS